MYIGMIELWILIILAGWAISSYISLIIGVVYAFRKKHKSVADRIRLTALSALVILSSPIMIVTMIKDKIEL